MAGWLVSWLVHNTRVLVCVCVCESVRPHSSERTQHMCGQAHTPRIIVGVAPTHTHTRHSICLPFVALVVVVVDWRTCRRCTRERRPKRPFMCAHDGEAVDARLCVHYVLCIHYVCCVRSKVIHNVKSRAMRHELGHLAHNTHMSRHTDVELRSPAELYRNSRQ